MRGKLRDKRVSNKRDILKHDVIERRRSMKRDNRPIVRLEQVDDENYELELEQAEEEKPTPNKQ